ncbi:TPA: hypothetical protein DD690_01480 [Candidatus Daviesbacteria bacterium]|nr:hypothetical protein [Candidatus Daviesbacteria bacterium]
MVIRNALMIALPAGLTRTAVMEAAGKIQIVGTAMSPHPLQPVNHLRNAGVQHIVITGVVIMSIKVRPIFPKVIMFVTGNILGIGTQAVSVSDAVMLSRGVMIVLPVLPVEYV